MPRPDVLCRRTGLLTVLTLVISGCTAAPPGSTDSGDLSGAGPSVAPAAPEHTARAVQGVASCAELPQQPSTSGAAVDRMPPLRLPCLTPGPDIDLAALRGRPVLVNLWASWCGPCRDEMPVLQAAHDRYGEQVQFVGVDTKDAVGSAAAFLVELGVTYPQIADVDGQLLGHLRVPGLPVTVVLNAEGAIVDRHVGELDAKAVEDLLADVR